MTNVNQESRLAGRYIIVRTVSRVGDVGIFLALLWWLGQEWLVLAFAISAMFNYLTDFLGQKLWTFKSPEMRLFQLLREFCLYLAIRGGNIIAALGFWIFLHKVLGLGFWTATTVTVIVFWTIMFGLYRWLFIGSIRDLLGLVRETIRSASNKARSR
jgi:putative flippase GtrA